MNVEVGKLKPKLKEGGCWSLLTDTLSSWMLWGHPPFHHREAPFWVFLVHSAPSSSFPAYTISLLGTMKPIWKWEVGCGISRWRTERILRFCFHCIYSGFWVFCVAVSEIVICSSSGSSNFAICNMTRFMTALYILRNSFEDCEAEWSASEIKV